MNRTYKHLITSFVIMACLAVGTIVVLTKRTPEQPALDHEASHTPTEQIVNEPALEAPTPSEPTQVTADFRKGFTSLESEHRIKDLTVTGTIPAWLRGYYLALGPAKFEMGESSARSWHDGFAMIHRFSFKQGHKVSYANAFLDTRYRRESIAQGCMSNAACATDPNASYFAKLKAAMSDSNKRPPYDNTNITIIPHALGYIALTESPVGIVIDKKSLETRGELNFSDTLNPHVCSPNPIIDPATGEMFNVATTFGHTSTYTIYKSTTKKITRIPLAQIKASYPSYIHSFALTKNYVALIEYPFVVNPYDLVTSGKPYLENYVWKPKQGTKITIVDRQTGALVSSVTTDPFFALHQVNAFETHGSIFIDLAVHQTADVVNSFTLNKIYADATHQFTYAQLKRIAIDPARKTVQVSPLSETRCEMPTINKEYMMDPSNRFVYALSSSTTNDYYDQVCKIDLNSGSTSFWHQAGSYPGQPTFIAAPQACAQDEGVLMSIVLDGNTNTSFLLILNAQTMQEQARVRVPHHIPYIMSSAYQAKDIVNNPLVNISQRLKQ